MPAQSPAVLPGPTLADIAWGAALADHLTPDTSPPILNLDRPDLVASITRACVDAGATLVTTNTLSANRLALCPAQATDRLREINEQAVAIARDAAGTQAAVFALLGPTGRFVALGEIDATELRDTYTEQLDTLLAAGIDGVVIEAMTDPHELRAALEAATGRNVHPLIATMTFDSGPDNDRTALGARPEDLLELAEEFDLDAVGFTCARTLADAPALLRRLAGPRPLWVRADVAPPRLADGRITYPIETRALHSATRRLLDSGAAIIGLCCGGSPDVLAALRPLLRGT